MSYLSCIVSRSQQLLSEVLQPGDLVVDLTAGNGSDTLFLAQSVGPSGQVLSFDIQEQALFATTEKLKNAGMTATRLNHPSSENNAAGVFLIATSHEYLADYLHAAPRGVIANLGYLPGGDKDIITKPDSTVTALQKATEALAVGGRMTVVVYPGHPGGAKEGVAVETLFASLPLTQWNVLRIEVPNSDAAPYLLVAEKRC